MNNSKKLSIGKDLLIATGNRGKFQEISQIISSIPISCFPAYDFVEEEPDEDGNSFAENALLKAKYYARKTGLTALADDSGICIVDLNNKPGIHSARYAINDETKKRDFGFAFIKIQNELKSKNINPQSNPRAFFICNLALFDPKNNLFINFEGRVDGFLTFPARGDNGFGYDPIFIKNGMNQTFAEINNQLKDQISHRALAMKKLKNFLNSFKDEL